MAIARVEGSQIAYLHPDILGPQLVTDQNANEVFTALYEPFGTDFRECGGSPGFCTFNPRLYKMQFLTWSKNTPRSDRTAEKFVAHLGSGGNLLAEYRASLMAEEG